MTAPCSPPMSESLRCPRCSRLYPHPSLTDFRTCTCPRRPIAVLPAIDDYLPDPHDHPTDR